MENRSVFRQTSSPGWTDLDGLFFILSNLLAMNQYRLSVIIRCSCISVIRVLFLLITCYE